jgi:hypothetical protein
MTKKTMAISSCSLSIEHLFDFSIAAAVVVVIVVVV